MVHAAFSEAVDEIPWNENERAFWVARVGPQSPLRARFDGPFVYMLGSHESCGCGFVEDGFEDEGALLEKKRSRAALIELLSRKLSRGIRVELFIGWAGNEKLPRPERESVRIQELQREDFWRGVWRDAIRDVPHAYLLEA